MFSGQGVQYATAKAHPVSSVVVELRKTITTRLGVDVVMKQFLNVYPSLSAVNFKHHTATALPTLITSGATEGVACHITPFTYVTVASAGPHSVRCPVSKLAPTLIYYVEKRRWT